MTTEELERMLVQIVNDAPPDELAAQIGAIAGLPKDAAARLADVIVTHEKLAAETAEIKRRGGIVDIPPEIAG